MATLDILVKPRSSSDRILLGDSGEVAVAVCAPPVDGEANDRVVRVIARALGVSRGSVRIVRGQTGRRKTIAVDGITLLELQNRLKATGGGKIRV